MHNAVRDNTLTAEQRIERAFVEITSKDRYLFLASILMHGKRTVIDQPSVTAMTDGRDVIFGREFVDSLTDAELRFLILHEAYHKLYRHMRTWRFLFDKSARCANQACDYVINLQITSENSDGFAVMPKGGLMDSKYKGMNSKEVFDLLYEQEEDVDASDDGETGETLDIHDWEGAQELSKEEEDELEAEVDSALREGAILAGRQGAGLSDDVKNLLKPKVDWRKETRQFASEQCAGKEYGTFARPNRRFIGSDIYLPTPISETIPELVFALDTSGSCWSFLPCFLGALKDVCRTITPHKLHVIFWDAQVVHEVYKHDEIADLEIKHAHGGGGTDVNCVTTYLRENNIRPTASIILTDAYLSNGWGTWDHPTLWVIADNPQACPPKGKVVHINTYEDR